MKAIVAERGQVTIPKPLRERLGITPRTAPDFFEEDGRLVAVKVVAEDSVAAVTGCIQLAKPVDGVIEEMRESIRESR